MSIEGQGHFFTIYFPGFVCFVLYYTKVKISGERLQDQWSSGFLLRGNVMTTLVPSVFIPAGKEDKHPILDEIKIGPD